MNTGGIGILGAFFLLFVTLKLTEIGPVAEWSWWWVTSPLWGGFLFFLLFALGALIWYGVQVDRRKRRRG